MPGRDILLPEEATMWTSQWYQSAHARLKLRYRRHLALALGSAGLLVVTAMLVAPPYIPASPAIEIDAPELIVTEPDYRVIERPAEIRRPELRLDYELSLHAPPTQTIPPVPPLAASWVPPQAPVPTAAEYVPDQLPDLIHCEAPVYPEIARQARAEGRVEVGVLVGVNGRVLRAWIVRSDAAALLEEAALRAARTCIFRPAEQGASKVRCQVVIPFVFELGDS